LFRPISLLAFSLTGLLAYSLASYVSYKLVLSRPSAFSLQTAIERATWNRISWATTEP